LLWDVRVQIPQGILASKKPFNGVEFNPNGLFFVTAGTENGLQLWDVRKSFFSSKSTPSHATPVINYSMLGCRDAASATFNSKGTQLVASVKKSYPILYSTHQQEPLCIFQHPHFRNLCTLKSCSFAGIDEEYVASGSDDFKIYIWSIPDQEQIQQGYFDLVHQQFMDLVNQQHEIAKKELQEQSSNEKPKKKKKNATNTEPVMSIDQTKEILTGHRSIVNNVQFHPTFPILVSSGVEKVIKMWSPYPLNEQESTIDSTLARKVFTPSDYAEIFHDFNFTHIEEEEEGLEESTKTIALFDFFNKYESAMDTDSDSEEDSTPNSFSMLANDGIEYIVEFEDDDTSEETDFSLIPDLE